MCVKCKERIRSVLECVDCGYKFLYTHREGTDVVELATQRGVPCPNCQSLTLKKG